MLIDRSGHNIEGHVIPAFYHSLLLRGEGELWYTLRVPHVRCPKTQFSICCHD